jgi:apolipoprotein N-acyltransferase
MNKNTIKILLLIASFIVVCTAAWFIYPIFIFFGFLPIYLLNEHYDSQLVNKSNFKFFFAIYLSFLGWNLATTWWIINSTIVGATLAFTLNSLLMCIPVLMYRIVTQNIQKMGFDSRFHPLILVPFWVSFEYLHLNWDLTWPWLNLGNVFALYNGMNSQEL